MKTAGFSRGKLPYEEQSLCSNALTLFSLPKEEAITYYSMKYLKTYTSMAMMSACSYNWAIL